MIRAAIAAICVAATLPSYAATETIDVGTVYTNSASYLAANTAIMVPEGAAFDLRTIRNASYYNYQYSITISGDGPDGLGALRDTGTHDPKGDDPQIATITLSGDALIKSSRYMALLARKYELARLNLNNHTLTLDMADGKSFALFHSGPWNSAGHLKLVNGILLVPRAQSGSTFHYTDLELITISQRLVPLRTF